MAGGRTKRWTTARKTDRSIQRDREGLKDTPDGQTGRKKGKSRAPSSKTDRCYLHRHTTRPRPPPPPALRCSGSRGIRRRKPSPFIQLPTTFLRAKAAVAAAARRRSRKTSVAVAVASSMDASSTDERSAAGRRAAGGGGGLIKSTNAQSQEQLLMRTTTRSDRLR